MNPLGERSQPGGGGDSLSPSTTTFFHNASYVSNTGTIQFRVEDNRTHVANGIVPSGKTALELILFYCALDALVDAKERFDPPKCAPNTRDALQAEIVDWINTAVSSGLVIWLTGSAGSGKSAIAQTIAEIYNNPRNPNASFFFSRISGSPTRTDGDRLFPTIIYQLCLLLPEYKDVVLKRIRKDPAIFRRSRGSQMSTLFTKPLQQFSMRRWFRERRSLRSMVPLVIVIDGLDECCDPQVQCDLLRIIGDAASSVRRRPVRFLIASRSEAHITRTFEQYRNLRGNRHRTINLDLDHDASMAILTFLQQEFQKIHESHPLRAHLDPSWPSRETIALIVAKSSPQFILASTVMAYVSSQKHRPTERLAAILETLHLFTPHPDRPLEMLDLLYTFIFEGVPPEDWVLVQTILGMLHLASINAIPLPPLTPNFLETTLGLEPGDVKLKLEPLVSIIHLPVFRHREPIKSLHASLFDFLLNPDRSRNCKFDLRYAHAGLFVYQALRDPDSVSSFVNDHACHSSPIALRSLENLIMRTFCEGFHVVCPTVDRSIDSVIRAVRGIDLCVSLLETCYAKQRPQSTPTAQIEAKFGIEMEIYHQKYSSLTRIQTPGTSAAFSLRYCLLFGLFWTQDRTSEYRIIHAARKEPKCRHLLLHLVLCALKYLSLGQTGVPGLIESDFLLAEDAMSTECPDVQLLAKLCQEEIRVDDSEDDTIYFRMPLSDSADLKAACKAAWMDLFPPPDILGLGTR